MTIFWFSVFVFMLIVEFTTVNLVSLWFAVGAICSMFVSMFTDSFLFQLGAFSIISLLTIIITKPLVKKFKGFEVEATNTDRVIGKIADVTKEISSNNFGEVKIFGVYCTAVSDETHKVGTKVKVKAIDGSKLIVEKEEE